MKESLSPYVLVKSEFPFPQSTYCYSSEAYLLCLYCPPPDRKNKFTDAQSLEQFSDLLQLGNSLKGSLHIMGDFNFQFDQTSDTCTSKLLDLIETFGLSQSITTATHQHGYILDWVSHHPDVHTLPSVDYTLTSNHSYVVNQLCLPRPVKHLAYAEFRNLAAINLNAFSADLQSSLPHRPSAQQLNQCLHSIFDKNAPVQCRRISKRLPCAWYSTVSSQPHDAKRE